MDIPSVVERVSATSSGEQPSGRASRSRSAVASSIMLMKWGIAPRPSVSSRCTRAAAASAPRRGTGPSVPAFRYAMRSSTGNSARKAAASMRAILRVPLGCERIGCVVFPA